MMVLTELRLILDRLLQVPFIVEDPSENRILNFLVVLFLKEVIVEELHRPDHEKLATLETHVERANGSVCRETDRSTRKQGVTRLPNIDRCSIRVDEFETAVLIPVGKFILGVPVFFGVLARLIGTILLIGCFCGSVIKNRMFNYLVD